jgi:hypothetical protein
MRKSQMERHIRAALDIINAEISGNASGGKFARGLAAEGYAGGYRDALHDIQQLLNDVEPSNSRFMCRALEGRRG